MRYAILNYSGNVGKTTIARDILSYNLQDHELISIETINSDGKEKVKIKGDDGDRIFSEILLNDNLIIDIGSSNLELFFNLAENEPELITPIDRFIVPVTPDRKQQFDSLRTLEDIILLGVSPQKITLIFNQFDRNRGDFKSCFQFIIENVKDLRVSINPENCIAKHNLYDTGECLYEMISNDDFKRKLEEAKAEGNDELSREYAWKYIKQRKIAALNKQYLAIFKELVA